MAYIRLFMIQENTPGCIRINFLGYVDDWWYEYK